MYCGEYILYIYSMLIDCGEYMYLENRENFAMLVYFWRNHKLFNKVVDMKFKAGIVTVKLSLGMNEHL